MSYNEKMRGKISSFYERSSIYGYPAKQTWILENGTTPAFINLNGYFYVENVIKDLKKKFSTENIFFFEEAYFKSKSEVIKLKYDEALKINGKILVEFQECSYKNEDGERITQYLNELMCEEDYESFFSKDEDVQLESFELEDFNRLGKGKVYFDESCDKNIIEEIIKIFQNNLIEKNDDDKSRINLIVNGRHGFMLNRFNLMKPKIDLELNYGKKLLDAHETIINKLNKKNGKGIVLLHGEPGSGKTNYIKFLLSIIKKNVIYVPPMMAEFISSENFIPFLMDYPNSVIVIEDGENIIKKRDGGSSQAVANLLNLSDGILGECLKMQIIVTFNADISNIDPALMRKGRLIAEHKFGKLNKEMAQKLSDNLGFDSIIKEDMLLTDIYNQKEKIHKSSEEKNRVGF